MKILIACEESQTVCKAFRKRGHEAYSCDIQECSGGHHEWHIQQNVLPLLNGRCSFKTMDGVDHTIEGRWNMIIAHPPCTYMSKAGARWMYPKAGEFDPIRYEKAKKAKSFFMEIFNADCPNIVIENPTPLKCVELPEPTQKIQPFEFDPEGKHPFSKLTLLWIKGDLKKLIPTSPNAKAKGTWMPSNTGGYSRGQGGGRGIAHDAKTASKTFPGVAEAMAEQWGGKMSKAAYTNQFIKDNYDRINLLLPKGYKDRIKKQINVNQSVNDFIKKAIDLQLKSDKEQINIFEEPED